MYTERAVRRTYDARNERAARTMATFIISLCAILMLTTVSGLICRKAQLPEVIGQILVGILVGPSLLGVMHMSDSLSLFSDLDVTILIDGTSSSLGKLMNLVNAGAIDKRRVINTDSHAGLQASDIEDLFTPGEFLRLYNLTFHTDWKVGALNGKDRIIARISRAEGAPFKEHGKPADYLLRMPDRAKYLASLSEGTLAKWEGLFQAINATLS